MTSFFCFVNKRAIYQLGIISLAHALIHVIDFPVVNVHVDEISSVCDIARKHKYKLPSSNQSILPYSSYIRIEIIHGSQNVLRVLTLVGGY
jgi:hypothetical protein